jgi:putative membrane protein
VAAPKELLVGYFVRLVLKFVVIALAIWLAVLVVPGLAFLGSPVDFLLITAIFWLINTFVKPIVKLLSLPFVVLTFGLFIFLINFLFFWGLVWISGFWDLGLVSDGIVATFLGSVVVSVVSTVLNWFVD